MQYKPKSSCLKSPTRLKGTLQQCLQQSFHHIVMTSVKSTYHNHLTNPSETLIIITLATKTSAILTLVLMDILIIYV